MTNVLFAEVMDDRNVGWYAFAVLLVPVLVKFIWDAVDRFGVSRKTTIAEWQELFNSTNRTLQDVRTELASEREDHEQSVRKSVEREHECQRQITELRVRQEWMEAEFRREGKEPPWASSKKVKIVAPTPPVPPIEGADA